MEWPGLPVNLQERAMASAASWSNAGRLRAAEPRLTRLPMPQTPDQRRVLAQVAKLLAFLGPPDLRIGVRSTGDAATTTIERQDGGGFSLRQETQVSLPSVTAVLRFLVTRPIVELRLLSQLGLFGPFDIRFSGGGLETAEWDTYQLPPWVYGADRRRLWRLLTYIRTHEGRHNRVSFAAAHDDKHYDIWWTGSEYAVEDVDTNIPEPAADVRQAMRLIPRARSMSLETAWDPDWRKDPQWILFSSPDFKNPWD